MKIYLSLFVLVICSTTLAQENMKDSIPYASIPEAPENYTAGTVVARMIDGLGFRYYWASEGLTQENMDYSLGNDTRTIAETISHIYNLSSTVLNAAKKLPNERTKPAVSLSSFEERIRTLENLKEASMLFAVSTDMEAHKIIFKNANGETSFPFWNGINGQVEDAVWHAGQLVVMRRAAGNPIHPKVNVFLGKLNK